LLLAIVGLYGTIAFSVQQRTREFGLRLALGATPRDASRLVIVSGLRLVAAGTMLGVLAALLTTRVLTTIVFDISTTDLRTFVAVPVILMAVAGAACYIPTRRVSHIEPLRALNTEP
jgi:ABC-type antimicrobial peptide transport system permease subunit